MAQAMRAALIAHDEVLRTAIEAHDGFCSAIPVMVWLRHSPRRGPLSTRLLTPSAHLSCQCEWVSRLGRPSFATMTISAPCSTAPRG